MTTATIQRWPQLYRAYIYCSGRDCLPRTERVGPTEASTRTSRSEKPGKDSKMEFCSKSGSHSRD